MPGDAEATVPSPAPSRTAALREVIGLFLRLGTTAFGGPAVHVALLQDEAVRRRRWISREGFLDLLGATNLIPGPNSTEMAIHLGRLRAGFPGLVAAGAAFIAPAALITAALAWLYQRYGSLPRAAGFLAGVKPAMVAVVAQALWALGRVAIKDRLLAAVAVAALAASLLGAGEIPILAVAGAMVMAARRYAGGAAAAMLPLALPAAAAPAAVPFSLSTLFLVFLKTGSVLFGSGYVLLAFLRADLVERLGWLTQSQLLDAVAVGQVTPGPVLSTATFIGYVLGGAPGAVLATVGIFLPAFAFVALSGPLVPRLRASPAAAAFLDGVNAASLALMAAVTLELARSALTGLFPVAVAAASALVLFRWRVNSAWLVVGGGAAGLLAAWLGW
ncbi:MAG TPA: chromate efflux transporter [Anaeromyxobacteraceae bacterium]|nr:chromate efflux transporter [Anaeromyxobacteraceae bacterium]